MDSNKTIDDYLSQADWRVKENSQTTYSFSGLQGHVSNSVLVDWALKNMYTGEISKAHEDAIYHIHDISHPIVGYCFTGDTRVKLLNGTNPTMQELAENYSDNYFWVYSKDEEGYTVPGLAYRPRLTRKSAKIVEVKLDSGESIRCTPDHRFLLLNNQYLEASELKPGMSLMPQYFKDTRNGYLGLYTRRVDGTLTRGAVHRMVAEYMLGRELLDEEVVHHLDGDKFNNEPNNLEVLLDTDHRTLEISRTWSRSDMYEKAVDTYRKRNTTDEMRARSSYYHTNSRDKSEELKADYLDYARDNGMISYPDWFDQQYKVNHKVLSVTVLDYTADVYDFTVAKYHNFLLDAGVYVHNCAGWSMEDILMKGFNCGPNYIYSDPAKHLDALYGQINNFIFTLTGEWAGAQALNSFDTYSAGFIKKDSMDEASVYRVLRRLIFDLNIKTRIAMQSPFSNISVDLTVPEDLKYKPVIIGGKEQDFTYGDCQEEMNMFNHVLAKIMMEGDGTHKIFTFPIITYAITKDFPWDSDLAKDIFTFADEANSPYFSNFINSDQQQSDVRSMCPMDPATAIKVMINDTVTDVKLINLVNKEFKVYFNGEWKSARLIKSTTQLSVTITDDRNNSIELGENHQQAVIRNKNSVTLSAKDLIVGDYLIYDDNGIYNLSKIIRIANNSIRDDLYCVEVLI